ncbi:hypothetical protein TgHK011_003314 [Trichoderma gracile]|nr:hypothetical protein TgHK011_003314 [Trichoderma gracile]
MASSYGTHAPARKLKDSCDLCSASKLRCNKQKPTCARCASLNQPCSYSPARRAGRPHRVREKSQQQCLEMSVDSTMESRGDGGKSREMSLDTTFLCMQSIRHDQSHQQQRQQQQQQQQQQQAAEPPSCQAPYQDAGGGDCARIAITILEHLDVARRRANHTSVSSATTDACQRLLTILIPLYCAAGAGNKAIAEMLLKADEAGLNAMDVHGQAPLAVAAYAGYKGTVQLLLDYSADKSIEYGRSPGLAIPSLKRFLLQDQDGFKNSSHGANEARRTHQTPP